MQKYYLSAFSSGFLMLACATTQAPLRSPDSGGLTYSEADTTENLNGPTKQNSDVPNEESAPSIVVTPVPNPPCHQVMPLVLQGQTIQREGGEGGAKEAIQHYLEALKQDPNCLTALWELGWSYQVSGDLEAASVTWQKLQLLAPDYPELNIHQPVLAMRLKEAMAIKSLPEPDDLPLPSEKPCPGPTLTVNAVGDVHLGRGWPEDRAKLPPNDGRDLFSGVSAILRDAAVTFGNLETALRDEGDSTKCGPKSTKCFAFRVPTKLAPALKDAGFNVMSIANNHAGDFGPEGRASTKAALDSVGILHSGPLGDIAAWEKNGLRLAMIAFSTGAEVYRVQEISLARKVVADLSRKHDIVIVSFHAGAEGSAAARVPKTSESFYGESRGNVYEFAHAVVDAGADLVIGHGPHRLRGMEIYRERLIAYSLGNFSTWETFSLEGPLGITAILKVTLAPNGVLLNAELVSGQIEKPGRPILDSQNRALAIVRELSKQDFGDTIFDIHGQVTRHPKP